MEKIFIYTLMIGMLFFSCQHSPKTTTIQDTPKEIVRPEFNEDSAFAYIEKQISFGPRVPNTIAHEKCADF